MPTTDVNINQRLSTAGFDGRTSHPLQVGSTGDAQADAELHKDTEDLQVCLHPNESDAPAGVDIEIPETLPYSPDIKDQYVSSNLNKQARTLALGTLATDSASFAQSVERVDASSFLIDDLRMPNDVLPSIAGRKLDLSGSDVSLSGSSSVREIKRGDDGVIDRNPQIYGASMYWFDQVFREHEMETTELSGSDLFEIGPTVTFEQWDFQPIGPGLRANSYEARGEWGNALTDGLKWQLEDPLDGNSDIIGPAWAPFNEYITLANFVPKMLWYAMYYMNQDVPTTTRVASPDSFAGTLTPGISGGGSILNTTVDMLYPFIESVYADFKKKPVVFIGQQTAGFGSNIHTLADRGLWGVDFLQYCQANMKVWITHPKGFDIRSLNVLCETQETVSQGEFTAFDSSKVKHGEDTHFAGSFPLTRYEVQNKITGNKAGVNEQIQVPFTEVTRTFHVPGGDNLFKLVSQENTHVFSNWYQEVVNDWLLSSGTPTGSLGSELPEAGTWLAEGHFNASEAARRGIVDLTKRSQIDNEKWALGNQGSGGIEEMPKNVSHNPPTDAQKQISYDLAKFTSADYGEAYDPDGDGYYSPVANVHTGAYGADIAYRMQFAVNQEQWLTGEATRTLPTYTQQVITNDGHTGSSDSRDAAPSEFILGGNPASGAFPDPAMDATLADAIEYNTWEYYDHKTTLLVPDNPLICSFSVRGSVTATANAVSWRSNVSILTEDNLTNPEILERTGQHELPNGPWPGGGYLRPRHSVFWGAPVFFEGDQVLYAPEWVDAVVADGDRTESLISEKIAVASELKSVDFHYASATDRTGYNRMNRWGIPSCAPEVASVRSVIYDRQVIGYNDSWMTYYNSPSSSPDIAGDVINRQIWDDMVDMLNGSGGDGVARSVNNLALLSQELGWAVEPSDAQKGVQEVPGSRWFDWKKMAMDLLPGNRGARVQARLNEGLYDDLLNGPETMASVFEAVDYVTREDYVDGANGWDSTGAALLDEHLDRDAAIASDSIPAMNDGPVYSDEEIDNLISTDAFESAEIRLNTDYFRSVYGGAGVGVPGVVDALRDAAKSENVDDLSNSHYWSDLRVCSSDGSKEVDYAWSLLHCIINSCSDGSIRDSVIAQVNLASQTGFTASAGTKDNFRVGVPGDPVYLDSVPLRGGGHLGPFADDYWEEARGAVIVKSPMYEIHPGPHQDSEEDTQAVTDADRYASDAVMQSVSEGVSWVPQASQRCDTEQAAIDPFSGEVKTIAEIVNLADVQSRITYTPEQLADSSEILPRFTGFDVPDVPADMPASAQPGDAGEFFVGYDMHFTSTIPDPKDWEVIADYAGRTYRAKPDTLTFHPTYEATLHPKRMGIPYGFNTLEDDTSLVASLTPQELGILPARTMFEDTPDPTSDTGETLHTVTDSDVFVDASHGGGAVHIILREPPHMFGPEGPTSHEDRASYDVSGYVEGDLTYNIQLTIPFEGNMPRYRDPELMKPNPVTVNVNWADSDDRGQDGTWTADGTVFDARATMELFNRDKRGGTTVNASPPPVQIDREVYGLKVATEFPDDSVVVRKFKEHEDSVSADVATGGTFVLAGATPVGVGGLYNSHPQDPIVAIHPALHYTSGQVDTEEDAPGGVPADPQELLVHPDKEYDFAYYQYEVSGQTKYMYPVYSTASGAESADKDLGADGVAVAYGVDGGEPTPLATQQDIDDFSGTVLYQTETSDTDVREVFNRHKLYSTEVFFRAGDENGELLDKFFLEYPDVAAGTSHDPDDPVDSAVSTLTWNELVALLTDPDIGGDTSDPDPGRRMRYLLTGGSELGLPLSPAESVQDDALTPQGARLASKFKPGWMWGGEPSEDTWDIVDAYARGLAREAASVTSYSQVPEDNFNVIDDRYLAQFIPYEGVTTFRVTV